jgi:hypothetical protein
VDFIEDALAFKRVSLRVGRTLAETVVAWREDRPHALIVDIDAMTPHDARQLQAAIVETEWHGPVIAIGDPTPEHRESLPVGDILGSKLTSLELVNTLARVIERT